MLLASLLSPVLIGAAMICVIVWLLAPRRPSLPRAIAVLAVRTLAVHHLLAEMWDGAWQRRERWQECLQRARWEV
jgi:hypothetical protein